MNVKKLANLFGAVLLAVGILGFVPGITSNGHLLGIFAVDTMHNIVHIVSGVLAILAARGAGQYAALYFKVFGIVYAAVTVLGFLDGSSIVGLFGVNMADNLLHLVIAAVALYIGFMGSKPAAPVAAMGGGQQM